MSKKVNKSTPTPIKCDDLFYSIPRSLCAASVANCIIKQCHLTYPNGQMISQNPQRQYLEWKTKCSKTNEFCNKHTERDLDDLQPIQIIRRK